MKRPVLQFTLYPEDRVRLEALAAKWEMPLAAAIRRVIKEFVEKEAD
jgi:hypothetical protein